MNLPELMVSVGISSILALGAGATLIRSMNDTQKFENNYQVRSIALTAARDLVGYKSSIQAAGGANTNCGGRITISNIPDVTIQNTFQTKAMSTDGTGYPIILNHLATDSGSIALQAGNGVSNSKYVVKQLSFQNAVILPNDPTFPNSTTYVGDLFINSTDVATVDINSTTNGNNGIPQFRQVFVARLVLSVNNAVVAGVATVNSCNAVSSSLASNQTSECSSIGDSGTNVMSSCQKPPVCNSTLEGGCTTTSSPQAVALCPLGTWGTFTGTTATPGTCRPIVSACGSGKLTQGILNGDLKCSNTWVNITGGSITSGGSPETLSGMPNAVVFMPQPLPGVPLYTPLPNMDNLPINAQTDPVCAEEMREYEACVIANSVSISNGIALGSLPNCDTPAGNYAGLPNATCSSTVVNDNSAVSIGVTVATVTPTPGPIPDGAPCNCGGAQINALTYCGFCVMNVDYGLGIGVAPQTQAQQCNNGALMDVSGIYQILLPANPSANCDGRSHQLTLIQPGILQIP